MKPAAARDSEILRRWTAWIFGYDVFISYRHATASRYAEELYRQLVAEGLICFLDREDTPPSAVLAPRIRRGLGRSQFLVLIADAGLLDASSNWIAQEVGYFADRIERIIPISIDGFLNSQAVAASPFASLQGVAWLDETASALAAGQPSPHIVPGVVRSLRWRRVRRLALASVAALVLTVASGGYAQWYAKQRVDYLTAATEARELTSKSDATEAVRRLLESLPHSKLSPRPLVPRAAWALREILARHYRQEVRASDLPALHVSEGVDGGQPLAWRSWFQPKGGAFIRRPRRSDDHVDEQALVVASIDGDRKLFELSHAGAPIVFSSFCSGGSGIVTASNEGTIRLWNGESGAVLKSFDGVAAPAVMAVAPDCGSVVMGAAEGPLTVFDFGTGKPRELAFRQPAPPSITYLGPSKLAIRASASRGATATLELWDLAVNARLDVSLDESNAMPIASHDGTRFSIGASIYDGSSFERLATLSYRQVIPNYSGGSERVSCPRISFAMRSDLVAGLCGLDLLVMRQSGQEVTRAQTHSFGRETRLNESLAAPAFGFDDTIVTASNGDGTALLYSASSGEELAVLCGPHELVLDAFFTTDDRFFIARYRDGRVRIWPMYPDIEQLAATARDTHYSTPLKGVEPHYGSWNAEHPSCRGY